MAPIEKINPKLSHWNPKNGARFSKKKGSSAFKSQTRDEINREEDRQENCLNKYKPIHATIERKLLYDITFDNYKERGEIFPVNK